MRINTQKLLAGLLMITVFASCSRPVAYFQPTAREQFATTLAKSEPVSTNDAQVTAAPTPVVASTSTEQIAQANTALGQAEALVRNDSKLATDKTMQKRLNRVRTLLTSTSAQTNLAPTETNAPKKMNLVQRMMLKKMNKKITKQLAPNQPEKAMVNSGLLVGGIVLALVGLLLILLTTGTGSTVGVILLLLGAISLVLGLLAS